ncbi:hypothetical protein [Streptomyces calidiresistens]|uniref:hypothetical protein n=1 Tax=Streptomyces calidiresistens TaxID=1485586 RepID=UPI001E508685|nr:hypothetical protein [Streptomyces calidiresistens]
MSTWKEDHDQRFSAEPGRGGGRRRGVREQPTGARSPHLGGGALLARPENTVTSIARLPGVSRNTICNHVPELEGGRIAPAEATSTPELPQPTGSED